MMSNNGITVKSRPFLPSSPVPFYPSANHNPAFPSITHKTLTVFREQDSHDVVEILRKKAWNLQKSYKNELNKVVSNEYQLRMA